MTYTPSKFKIFNMWGPHSYCRLVVEEVWRRPAHGCQMAMLSKKSKALKNDLKIWNKEVFGYVKLKVDSAKKVMDNI